MEVFVNFGLFEVHGYTAEFKLKAVKLSELNASRPDQGPNGGGA